MQPVAAAPARNWHKSIPVAGSIADNLVHGNQDDICYFLVICLMALILAMKNRELVALGLTTLIMGPVIFVCLISS